MKLVAFPNKVLTIGNAGNGHHSKDVSDPKGISPTLTTGNHNNGQLIADRGVLIKNANSKGFLEANDGDGIDISTRMEKHRGTVQKGLIQTIKAQIDVGVCVEDED